MTRNLRLSYVIGFLRNFYFVIPIWYAFETQYVGVATLGMMVAASQVLTVIFELPTGSLADLIGRKRVLVGGLVVEALGWIVIGQTVSGNHLWVGYGLIGLSVALISGSDAALHYDSLKELGREKTYAAFRAQLGLVARAAIIIGSFAGGYIYGHWERLPYFLAGMSLVLAGLVALWLKEPRIDSETFSLKSYIKQTRLGFGQLFKNRYSSTFSFYYLFVGGISWYFMFFLNIAFATYVGYSSIRIGQIFAVINIGASLLTILITRKASLQRKYVYVGLPLIMLLGYLPGLWVGYYSAVITLFLAQFVAVVRYSLLGQYANMEFESKYRATALSSLSMLVSLLAALLTFLSGRAIESIGAGGVMTMAGVLVMMTALPLSVRLCRMDSKGFRDYGE